MEATKVFYKHDIISRLKDDKGNNLFKYIIHTGSSRSSKTISLIQWIDDYLTTHPSTRATVWRDTRTSLGSTVWSDYKKFFAHKHTFGKQTNPIHYDNNSIFEPHGADFTNAHGLTQDIAWINEPYKITKETFDAIDQRANLIIIDWNPRQGHWIDALSKNPRAVVIHSTFQDNQFCPEEQKLKILSYDPSNPDNILNETANSYNWQVYGLGIKAEKPNKIYEGWKKISSVEFDELDLPSYNGLDFGMVASTGMVEAKYKDGKLYLKQIWYKPVPRDQPYSRVLESCGIPKNRFIIADSAGATEIRQINQSGYTCYACSKGKGSVMSGIKFMQTLDVYYCGVDIEYEFDNYEWQVDRYGLTTEDPIKKDDHILDAIRYVAWWLKSYLNIQI